jgi:hypothetical protein
MVTFMSEARSQAMMRRGFYNKDERGFEMSLKYKGCESGELLGAASSVPRVRFARRCGSLVGS